jgi:hypothetical protein
MKKIKGQFYKIRAGKFTGHIKSDTGGCLANLLL